jgi:hypothetical protein
MSFKEVKSPQMKNKTVSMINENLAVEGVVCIIDTFKTKNNLFKMESKTIYGNIR